MVKIAELDIVFLTYDEPQREAFWRDLQAKFPRARRVHASKGLDGGFKQAVEAGDTDYVVTVDGDCIVDPAFFDQVIDDDLLRPGTRIDWPGRNAVNGVVSGNGGIKCWPKALARSMRSHETAAPEAMSIDFPRAADLEHGPYRVEHTTPMATVHINGSPLQAFRGAFREAIRLAVTGRAGDASGAPADRLHALQRHRLLIWCSVGADVENGLWCLYGARLATRMLHLDGFDVLAINDFDWFDGFWRDEIAPRFRGDDAVCRHTDYAWDQSRLRDEIVSLGTTLRDELGFEVADLTAEESRFFKRIYQPPFNLNGLDHLGTMFQRGVGVGRSDDKARACYEAAARVGHAGALYNLARLELADRDGGDASSGVALLREASALGSAHAAHRLGRMHRLGQRVERDPRRAFELFTVATERGSSAAHRDLAEMLETGEGVAKDLLGALRHYRRAAEAEPGLATKVAELEARTAPSAST